MAKDYPMLSGLRGSLIKSGANLNDTIDHIKHIIYRDYTSVRDLAFELKGRSVGETSENIWNYIRENITYQLDKEGYEELRTPARTLRDGIGDCDDFTILSSCILLNLGIPHELRIAAYEQKGVFQHIYLASIDRTGNAYIIDAVPEIPHFNYEEPYIDIKTINMDLVELSGLGSAASSILEQEQQRDLIEDLNAPFTLSGFDHDDSDLEDHFLEGFEVVDSESQADITISSSELPNLIDKGILAEVNKARLSLIKEQENPTVLSQTVNVPKELSLLNQLMESWDDESARDEIIETGLTSNSDFANFYRSIQISLDELAMDTGLSGMEEDIHLAKMAMDEILDEDMDLSGRRRGRGRFKNLLKKVGSGIKKGVKAVVRYNPATIALRGAVLLVLKSNLFKFSERLILGYLSEQEARSAGLDIANYRRAKVALEKATKFFVKAGGKESKFRNAIINGRGAKKSGITINGLGEAVTASATAAATPFITKVGLWLKKVVSAPVKLVKKIGNNKNAQKLIESGMTNRNSRTISPGPSLPAPTGMSMMDTNDVGVEVQAESTGDKIKAFFTKHKKKLLIGGGVVIFIIGGLIIFKKMKAKKKRSLAGMKAARTRKRNAAKKSLLGGRRTTRRKSKSLKGSTTIIRVPSKSISKSRVSKRSNANRLKAMHKKAKQLQKQSPNTKYSTLLKRAAKQI